MSYPHLFSPIRLGDTLVQNRIVANPMSEHYDDRCRGGAGVVICGHTIVEPGRSSWMSADEPYAFSKYERESTVARARMARAGGAAASIELAHAGQYARTVDYAMGPDGFVRADGIEVRAMTSAMMEHTAACWVQACVDARRAGFDMVFLHFGHGWLMGQFLSPLFNHRTDGYGGSIENRMRFPLQVLSACREAVGPRFAMEMRISADEWMPGGIELDDVIAFCREAQRYVTSIQVSCGLDIEHEANVHTSATYLDPHLLNLELARAVKAAVDVPVTLVGSVETPEEAERAIAEGACDMVALARALAADPLWPAKARDDRAEDIVPCLRCLQCYHISTDRWNVGCSVNPRFANEDFVPRTVEPAEVSKRVLVVGAGPAGCMAAITACARGHKVVLAERADRVGGNVRLIAQAIGHVEDLGSRVVVVGGGTIGAELALELAEQGHEVKVVEMGSALAAQGNSLFRIALRQMFDRQGKAIEVLLNTSCTSIGEEGVCVSGPDGAERVLACDSVVIAAGVRPRTALAEGLAGVVPQTYLVGDCRRARVIKDAVFEGYSAAASI